jgi:hypothetical protein
MAFVRNISMLIAGHGRGGFKTVLSRFTWELPQTMLGITVGTINLLRMEVDAVEQRDGVVVLRGWRDVRGWGGICFGTVILGDERIAAQLNNRLYMHEFGHTLQSRAVGPIYLLKYGLPSLLSAAGRGTHNQHPVERDANARACDYFSKQPGFETWPADFNPLPADGSYIPVHGWEFLPPIFPFRHLWLAYRDRDGSVADSKG